MSTIVRLISPLQLIVAATSVETLIIQADFSEGTQDFYDRIANHLKGLDIGLLINNVGACYMYPNYFCEISTDILWQLIHLNVTALTFMTRAVLPGMLARKRGAVVNIGSYAGDFPQGLLTVYSASKVYVEYFTRALHQEYSGSGVIFQSANPLYVVSKMSRKKRASLTVLSPEDYVRQAVRSIGYQTVTHGHVSHSIQALGLSLLPSCARDGIIFHINSTVIRRMRSGQKQPQQ